MVLIISDFLFLLTSQRNKVVDEVEEVARGDEVEPDKYSKFGVVVYLSPALKRITVG